MDGAEEACEPPVLALINAEVDNHIGSAVINWINVRGDIKQIVLRKLSDFCDVFIIPVLLYTGSS